MIITKYIIHRFRDQKLERLLSTVDKYQKREGRTKLPVKISTIFNFQWYRLTHTPLNRFN